MRQSSIFFNFWVRTYPSILEQPLWVWHYFSFLSYGILQVQQPFVVGFEYHQRLYCCSYLHSMISHWIVVSINDISWQKFVYLGLLQTILLYLIKWTELLSLFISSSWTILSFRRPSDSFLRFNSSCLTFLSSWTIVWNFSFARYGQHTAYCMSKHILKSWVIK